MFLSLHLCVFKSPGSCLRLANRLAEQAMHYRHSTCSSTNCTHIHMHTGTLHTHKHAQARMHALMYSLHEYRYSCTDTYTHACTHACIHCLLTNIQVLMHRHTHNALLPPASPGLRDQQVGPHSTRGPENKDSADPA